MELRKLAEGAYSQTDSRGAHVALDESSYRSQWRTRISPDEQPPAVDFESETVVFLFAGRHSSGGYSIVFNGATLEGDTLVVDAVVQGPPPGSMTTQALTTPYYVFAVKSRAVKAVRWQ